MLKNILTRNDSSLLIEMDHEFIMSPQLSERPCFYRHIAFFYTYRLKYSPNFISSQYHRGKKPHLRKFFVLQNCTIKCIIVQKVVLHNTNLSNHIAWIFSEIYKSIEFIILFKQYRQNRYTLSRRILIISYLY